MLVKENEIKTKEYLLKLGFQPNLKGYRLLSRLICYALDGVDILPLKYKGYESLSSDFDASKASNTFIVYISNQFIIHIYFYAFSI